jgi:phage terminase large subunit-like protein
VFSEWRQGAALLFTLPTGSVKMSIDRTLTAVYVPFSNPPNQPVNVSPANGATTTNTTPTLVATAFSDHDGDSHVQTQWEIANVATGVVIYRTNSAVNKTSLPVPAGRLSLSTQYSWTVQYKDSAGVWSAKSAPTTFWTPDVEGAGEGGPAIQNNGTPSGP